MSRPDERGSIAEFHDIGKIVNWFALGLQGRGEDGKLEREPHDFEKCMGPEWGIDFSAPVWEAIFRKSDPKGPAIRELRLEHFPGSRDWFIVSIADELAAGMGRLREEQFLGDPNYSYYCLWTGKARGDLRLAESHQLNELICHLNTNPSWEDTCRKYFQILRSRVETAHPGLNVSTLHAHALLTGKLARLLKPLASAVTSTMHFKDAEKASGAQKLVPVLLEIVFPQQPFRTRDLAIFQARRNAIASAAEHFKDNLLIRYGNYLLALFLSAADANGLIQFFANQGLIVRVKSAEQTLQYLSSPKIGITEALARAPAANWFGELPNLIAPPLCENCQMAHGDHRWPADFLTARGDLSPSARERISSMPWMALRGEDFAESDLTIIGEWLDEPAEVRLCARCFGLRQNAPPLTRLSRWDSGKVAWARITLDLSELEAALRQLHIAYIKAQANRISASLPLDQLPVRLPLVADFVAGYELALEFWQTWLRASFGKEHVEIIDEGFACVKLEERPGALRLLEIHHELLREHFPKLLELETSPVRFALSIAPAKHPFFANWRFLENADAAVAVQLVGSGRADIPISRLDALMRVIRQGGRHAFHRLREIARTSKALAELVLADRTSREQNLEILRRIQPLGLNFESLMTLANLAADDGRWP